MATTKRLALKTLGATSALALLLLLPTAASAACTSPAGVGGDIAYGSNNVMAYCNGTIWISMGAVSDVGYGTLTTGDFCTAISSTQIACTTAAINMATQATGVLPPANGGTGVANSATITLGGNLSTGGAFTVTGAFGVTLTATGVTSLTLPTSGTVVAIGNTPVQGDILYYNGSAWTNLGAGTSGQYLQTQGTGAAPVWSSVSIGTGQITGTIGVTQGGTGTATQFTQGSVVFAGASGVYSQDNANFFWDATNHRLGIGTATPTANLTINGTTALVFGSDYTTTGLQAAVNLGAASSVRYAGTAAATFYGIAAGVDGQLLRLHNASGYTLTLANQSTLEATTANRIVSGTGNDLLLTGGASIVLQYDASTARWRALGVSVTTPAGTTGQVQFNNSGAFGADSALFWDNTNKYLGVGTDTPAYNLDAATGTVAGTIVQVVPQAISMATTGGAGSVSISASSTGQMAYFSSGTVLEGTPLAYVGTNGIGIGTSTTTAALTVKGTTAFQFGSDYATSGLQADVNLGSVASVRYNGGATATFYGVVAGVNGQMIMLHNGSSYALTLANQSSLDGTAANRIVTGTGADLIVASGAMVILHYDGTAARWRVIGAADSHVYFGTTVTATNPQIQGDATSGLYTPAGSTIAIVVGGTEQMRVNSSGYVGVGTTSPVVSLDLSGRTDALALPVGTTGTRPTSGNLLNGEVRYNSTTPGVEAYINNSWQTFAIACSPANTQTITATGTWTKPSCGTTTKIQCWGAGGGGSTTAGGGGGGYNELIKATSALGATETVTVGAGGATGTAGGNGGNTTFGSWVTAYGGGGGYTGGGGGGGTTSAGSVGTTSAGGAGGNPMGGASGGGTSIFGGGGGGWGAGGASVYGGGGGGYSGYVGAASVWGGGGGAGSGSTAGASTNGGAGGTSGAVGVQPGGGGGKGAAGGAGQCTVTTW